MRDDERFVERIDQIKVLNQHGYRAPHKPLRGLLALGRMLVGHERPERYQNIAGPWTDLLKRFGPPRTRHHPEYPFGYLRTDKPWEVPGVDVLPNTDTFPGVAVQADHVFLATGRLRPTHVEKMRGW